MIVNEYYTVFYSQDSMIIKDSTTDFFISKIFLIKKPLKSIFN